MKYEMKKMKKFLIIYEKTKTGYSAYPPDLPGVAATGPTKNIVEKLIYKAIQARLEMMGKKNKNTKGNSTKWMMVFVSTL